MASLARRLDRCGILTQQPIASKGSLAQRRILCHPPRLSSLQYGSARSPLPKLNGRACPSDQTTRISAVLDDKWNVVGHGCFDMRLGCTNKMLSWLDDQGMEARVSETASGVVTMALTV
jgi:hypothetical protein